MDGPHTRRSKMGARIIRGFGPVCLLSLAVTGCAATHQQRIAMLEEINKHLTERLNEAQAEVDAADQEQAELDTRLLAALDEADALRLRLEEVPTPAQLAPGWTAVPGGAMIAIEGDILFETGKVVLRGEARRALDGIASTIQSRYADKDILVVGHTDDQPIKKSGWKDNYQLSTERALPVVRHLMAHGVAPARLMAGGCGEHHPRVPNESDANRATNRRVEIFAIDSLAFSR